MKNILRPLGVTAVLSLAAFLLSGTAQAQTVVGPSANCDSAANSHSFGPLFNDAWVFSSGLNKPNSVTQALAVSIPAGTYDLSTVAWDGNRTRPAQGIQPVEIYFLELLDAGGNVLATSGLTQDLEDLVFEATWAGSIGQVSWTGADATQVRVVHGSIGYPDLQSVHAICFGWTPVQVQTTTTTTTTSTPPVDPSTSTTTTTTTSSTTTTEVPTVVLPEVEVSQPADPVQGDPTFTG